MRRFGIEQQFDLADRLPANAVGGIEQSGEWVRALLAGIQVVLTKPIAPEELVAVMASLPATLRNAKQPY